jgi:hypothetical protein
VIIASVVVILMFVSYYVGFNHGYEKAIDDMIKRRYRKQ